MKYAVISLAGKQHVVTEGETLEVNLLPQEVDGTFELKDVLLVVDGETCKVGAPLVEGARVKVKLLDHHRGEKIRVATYKAKSRQRKVRGHRQELSSVEITSISA